MPKKSMTYFDPVTRTTKWSKASKHKSESRKEKKREKKRAKKAEAAAAAEAADAESEAESESKSVGTRLPPRGFHASELAPHQSISLSSPAASENVLAAEAPNAPDDSAEEGLKPRWESPLDMLKQELRNLGNDRLLKLHRDIAAVEAETDELHPNFCSH